MREIWSVMLAVVLTVTAAAQTDSEPEKKPETVDPALTYGKLVSEFGAANRAFYARLRKAKTKQEKRAVYRTAPHPDLTANKLLALAKAHPAHRIAADALAWVTKSQVRSRALKREALKILLRDHLQSAVLHRVCQNLSWNYSREASALLWAALKQSKLRTVQAVACYTLATRLKSRARGNVEQLKEAEALFERVIEKYADQGKLLPRAKAALNEMRNLAIGKKAPEVTGTDLDGQPLKLSDFIGKVVVFYFWGNW